MLLHRTFAVLLLLAPIAFLPRAHAFVAPTPFVRHAPACGGGLQRGQASLSLCRPPLARLRMAESGGLPSTLSSCDTRYILKEGWKKKEQPSQAHTDLRTPAHISHKLAAVVQRDQRACYSS